MITSTSFSSHVSSHRHPHRHRCVMVMSVPCRPRKWSLPAPEAAEVRAAPPEVQAADAGGGVGPGGVCMIPHEYRDPGRDGGEGARTRRGVAVNLPKVIKIRGQRWVVYASGRTGFVELKCSGRTIWVEAKPCGRPWQDVRDGS